MNFSSLHFLSGLISIVKDVTPLILLIGVFQVVVLKKSIPNFPRVLIGLALMILGLYLFVMGLEMGVFPIGETLAKQFSLPQNLVWVYPFAFCVGYSTTIAEPALLAISLKAEEISSGTISSFGLRNAVAFGVAVGILLGVFRIVMGKSLVIFILGAYVLTIVLTVYSPKYIVALAYDSGGVTTSTVTVPLVAALGIGLAANIEGRDPLIDGFGLIAFASVFPMIMVLGYALVVKGLVALREKILESKMY